MNKPRARAEAEEAGRRRITYESGRSLVFVGLVVRCAVGQTVMGQRQENEGREAHGQPRLRYAQSLCTDHCLEAFAEHWEGALLQMGGDVLLTAFLRQKGFLESKKLAGEEAVARGPRQVAPHPDPCAAAGSF